MKKQLDPGVTVDGIPGMASSTTHFDVNGKWGGYRAVVAHFRIPTNPDFACLYILVGEYFSCGRWPDDDPDEPTPWEIARLVTEAVQKGANRRRLYKAIKKCLKKDKAQYERDNPW